ncbi:hypothetical protein [Pseudomonas sp. Irchel s3f10]|uniref:hypothetical protein n=1 Tax=Pseudomonas sp. Irchel s3f10 TaxID=2009137 RepID=UPI000BA3F2C4|nr:hypothetical protein [Pseudomonas sp. Irchel s3f10]
MRNFLLLSSGVLLALSGCASVKESWAPFPTAEELMSFNDQWAAAKKTSDRGIFDLQRELVVYRDRIYERALTRNKLNWESSGATTYGGLAAVVGALADQTGLMNSGAGLAALGLTNSNRYRFTEQTQIYVAALKKLSCITGKVNAIDDITIELASHSRDSVARDAAAHFVEKVVASVDYIRAEYTNSLLGLAPVIASREEMMALVVKYRAGTEVGVAEVSPDQERFDAAGETTVSLTAALQGCTL